MSWYNGEKSFSLLTLFAHYQCLFTPESPAEEFCLDFLRSTGNLIERPKIDSHFQECSEWTQNAVHSALTSVFSLCWCHFLLCQNNVCICSSLCWWKQHHNWNQLVQSNKSQSSKVLGVLVSSILYAHLKGFGKRFFFRIKWFSNSVGR